MTNAIRFVECIGPGLAAIAHGGKPVVAYEHVFGPHSRDVRMHRLANESEGPRRIETVIILLDDRVHVGVTRDARGRPRTDGVVYRPSLGDRLLCFESVAAEYVRARVGQNDAGYDDALALAEEARAQMFSAFAAHDCEGRQRA